VATPNQMFMRDNPTTYYKHYINMFPDVLLPEKIKNEQSKVSIAVKQLVENCG